MSSLRGSRCPIDQTRGDCRKFGPRRRLVAALLGGDECVDLGERQALDLVGRETLGDDDAEFRVGNLDLDEAFDGIIAETGRTHGPPVGAELGLGRLGGRNDGLMRRRQGLGAKRWLRRGQRR